MPTKQARVSGAAGDCPKSLERGAFEMERGHLARRARVEKKLCGLEARAPADFLDSLTGATKYGT